VVRSIGGCETNAQVVDGSIYDLPHQTYDAVSSFFVSESITGDPAQFKEAVNGLIDSVKPGGLIVVAHMLGSEGYYAGEDTSFPAVAVGVEDLKKVYAGKADVEVTQVKAAQEAREGYHGMAIVVGKKR
jgi:hypothetical protein